MLSATALWFDHPDPETENKWRLVRQHRDELLTRSDWTQIPDVVLSEEKKAEWIAYRQALRDIPENYTNPDEVIFPDEPENA
jgi:hypothetical protein